MVEGKIRIFISRKVFLMMMNNDAISTDVYVTKFGGTDEYGKAVPCLLDKNDFDQFFLEQSHVKK